jgi:hypothetical protein
MSALGVSGNCRVLAFERLWQEWQCPETLMSKTATQLM